LKLRLQAILFLFLFPLAVIAGNKYWTGGSGNWNDPANWSLSANGNGGAGIPAKSDDVIIVQPAGSAKNFQVEITGDAFCASFSLIPDIESSFSTGRLSISGNGNLYVNGSLSISIPFEDHFTGKWIFSDPLSDLRDNSVCTVSTGGHIFAGAIIFAAPSGLSKTNNYLVADRLYVNNTVTIDAQAYVNIAARGALVCLELVAKKSSYSAGPGGFIAANNPPPSPQSHTVTTIVIPNLCNGDCLASATAVVTGGSGSFSYQWSNSATTQTATNLCAGTYLVVVTDLVNGDQVPAFAIVQDPPPLVIFFSNTAPLCNGDCNGSSSASVAGGTAPYTYSWAPNGQTTATITNQCAGSYTLTVTDSNSCTVTATSVITQPAVLQPNGTSTNITCFNACDGTATTAPTGGTGPYSYSWSNGPTTPGVTNLCPGTYTCTVTDSHTCTATYTTTITQPQPLSVSLTGTNTSCNAVCDGTASSTVTGGTLPFSYSWSNGPTTPNINGLCAGTYTLTVTDANNCTASATITITQPGPLLVNPTGTNITCFNACNGTAAANAVGGTSPYTYSWAPNGGNGATASNLCPGTYTVTVTDANGCIGSGTVTLTQPALLIANASGTNISCFGACNGSATANPSGGTGPYSYNWMPGNLNTQTISILCPASYTVTVTDANNCTATQVITITEPAQLQGNITSTNVSCNGACDGTATSVPSGGVGPYTFNWQPGNMSTNSVSALCPGSYTLTITDANGCTRTQTVTITQPNALSVSINASQINCNNSCTGTAAASVSGGTPGYSYSWAPNGETTSNISGLCVGSYTVTVTDNNGCVTTNSVTLTQPTALTLTTNITNASCNGSCDGSAGVVVAGGTPAYTYSWAPGGQTTPSINNLCAGTYTLTVTDATNCVGTATITIIDPPSLLANVTSINVTCNSACNGSATANPTGGTGPYTFLWSPGGQTTNNVTGLCAANYTVVITDANGCTVSQQVNITQPPPLLAVVASTTSSCGLCNGTASVAVSGGTSPYAYFWTPTNQTNPTATGLCIGQHTVTVTDGAGCIATATATITQVVNIVITSNTNSLSCFGACDGVASANAAGGTQPYVYNWQPNGQTTQTITGLCAGTYTVTATDSAGCFNSSTVTFVDPPQLVIAIASANTSCNSVCDGTATANPSGGTGAYTYLWAPGGETTQSINALCPGTYTVTVTDANNCSTTQTITITEPTLITANEAITDANCGQCDGSITANPSGGTGPYTFVWMPGNLTTQTISNLCPGIYTVTITDATGCSVNTPIGVSNLNGPTVAASFTNANCNGACDGTADATVTGGIGPFTYDWTPGNPAGDGTPNVTGLCAGTYFCQVTDNVGCITFTSFTITEPQQITSNTSIVNVSCNAGSDGSITVNPTGGTGPYTYSWLPGNQITQTVSGLTAGSYTVTITDANLCTATFTYTVTEPLALTASVTSTDVLCNGSCSGTGLVTVSGGTFPYFYNWSSGQGTAQAVNLCPGAYTIDITDGNGCIIQQSVTITEPPLLITSISSTNASCNGICDGTATVTASGGIPGYAYTWSPGGGTTPMATGLCAGAYSVITSDTNGCQSVQSVIITQPPAIVLSVSSGPISCFGNCNGVATVTASGGAGGFTYNWTPGAQTTATASGLCAGTYTIDVTDMNGCVQSSSTTVTQPSLLQANTATTPTSCGNTCDGTASANPVGGTGPYSYLWAPGGQSTSSQCAGTYTVTVRDANGCQDIQTVTISAASSMTLTVASAPATCGACDGTISITPVGGTSPYTYSWSSGLPAQPNQSALCANIYTVDVTDANGCVTSFTVVLNNNGGPTGETVVTTDVTCPNSCDGSATVTPIGGAAPYTYLWNPGGQTVNSLTNMCAGNYFLQVTDTNTCIRFSPVTINGPQPILGNAFVSNATCTGICDGSISLTPTGGNGPYTYLWAPGGQTTSSISGQCVGTYTVFITDANGCMDSTVAMVNPWNTLAASITSSDPNCAGTNSGTAMANILSGTAPFTYQWTDALAQNTQLATGLPAGTYSVSVSDAGGCSTTLSVTLIDPNPIAVTPVITPTNCGLCNGSVTLNTSGGVSPYTFLWSNGAPTSTVNGLCAGVYMVVVTDATGCSATFTVTVGSSGGPSITTNSVTDVSCFGSCDGAINITAVGTGPYNYLWLPTGQTTSSVSNLCAGTYTVQVQDTAGCIATQSFTVNSPSAIVLNQVITNPDCGVCNGVIALNTSGGTGPYTYLWAPGGQTTSTINNLCAGLYTVTVTDANNCTSTQTVPVSNANSPIVIATSATNVTCNGSCNGIAIASASGSTGPYTYNWSNGGTNDTLTALCPGNYLVQATDANGCVSTAQINITEPTPFIGSFLFVQDELCTGACNGTMTSIATGGTLPYAYLWSTIPAQTTATATGLCSGIYSVIVTDSNGCTFTQTDTIVSPVVLILGVPVITDATCNNSSDGSAVISVSGGTLPYTFNWTGPNSFTFIGQNLSGVPPGSYTVNISDANGCTIADTILINAITTVIANAGNDTTFCQAGSLVLDGSASVNATSYQWLELPGMTVVGSTANPSVNPPPGTTTYLLIVSNGVCSDTDTVIVNSIPLPVADAGPDQEIISGMTATIGGSPTGPAGATYSWGPSTGLGDPSSSNPVASPLTTTSYTVFVTDANGCTNSDTMDVIVVPSIDFPNGFTPNGDGTNDVWVIDNIQLFPNCQVEVYNRWGELLFSSTGYTTPWDGRYNNEDLPVGTYYYIIKLNDPLFPDVYTGPITIMR
jgi:gliding motility-associated-like protein